MVFLTSFYINCTTHRERRVGSMRDAIGDWSRTKHNVFYKGLILHCAFSVHVGFRDEFIHFLGGQFIAKAVKGAGL